MKYILLLLNFVILSCCGQDDFYDIKYECEIAILHTNDVHGEIENYKKIEYLRDSLLNVYDDVLLVSTGDIFSGNAYIDHYPEKGYPIIDLMNKVEYDISAIGNHEFDYGQDVLKKRIEQANFPFICANMYTNNSILKQPKSHVTITTHNQSITFLGLIETTNNGLPSTHPAKVNNIRFDHYDDVLHNYDYLRDSSNAYIILSHLGYKDDIKIAEKYNTYDVIIGGHSHTLINHREIVNNVLISQAGDDLEHVGLVVLKFDKGILVNKSYTLINFDNIPKINQNTQEIINSYYDNEYLNEIIGIAEEPFGNVQELSCLYTDAQISLHDLDFCFQNYYGIRIYNLEAGNITRKNIYDMDPFDNDLIVYELSGKDIKDLIMNSYYKKPDLLIGGGTYYINNDDVKVYDLTENEIDETCYYKVGLNSYIVESYNFNHDNINYSTNTKTIENIIKYLQKVKNVNYKGCRRAFD